MFRFVFTVLAVFSLLATSVSAQTKPIAGVQPPSKGVISGTVLDPQGNPVAHASVALSTPTEVREVVQTNDRGDFSFPGLAAGTYAVAASAPGLAAATGDIHLQTNEAYRADLSLALSAIAQRVVVSASLGDVLATQTASSVSVITASDMENRDAQSIPDVLRQVPGVAIADSGRRGGSTSAFVRGGNSNYSLVMVDGIPLNQFGGGLNVELSGLPVDGLAQVEVVRGAQSALYGSEAVTSVINLITTRTEGTPEFSAVLEGGSYDTYRLATGGSGAYRGVGWAYEVSRLDSAGVVTNDNYRNQSAFFSLGISRSPQRQFDFHFFGDANNAGSPGAYGSDPDHLFFGIDTISRDKQNLFGYQAGETEQLSSRMRQVSTVSVTTDRFYFVSPFGDSFEKDLRIVANTRSEIALAPTDVLVAGFEYNREQYQDTYVVNSTNQPFALPRMSLAFFAEDRWNPASRWSITAGLRVDDIRTAALPQDPSAPRPFIPANSITQGNPRGTVAYLLRRATTQSTWGATRLHGSAGTGIRAPNGFELGFTNNPSLKPERSITTDVGVEQRLFSDRVVVDFTYFYNRFKDQIVTLGGSLQSLSTFSSANLNNSRAQGVELSVRAQPMRNLGISGQYTWMDSAVLALDGTAVNQSPYQVGQPLIRRPRNAGSYDVTWRHGRLRVDSNGYARGQVLDLEPNDGGFACSLGMQCFFENHGYFVMNGGFAVRTLRGVEIYGQLNNLLNQKYEEVLGYPAYRLNFMAGIRLRFFGERGGSSRP